MKTLCLLIIFCISTFVLSSSFKKEVDKHAYDELYTKEISHFKEALFELNSVVSNNSISEETPKILASIHEARSTMKACDFWLRYLSPLAYKKINAPLPVEWEVEVFEKFEAPYKRVGAGLTLAEVYIDEGGQDQAELAALVDEALVMIDAYFVDSIYQDVSNKNHFFLANRLHLLNVGAIYTTGFECPNTDLIIPELKSMLASTSVIYQKFNESYPETPIVKAYLEQYKKMIEWVNAQPETFDKFNHFNLLKDFVNPLFALNQQMIRSYKIRTNNFNDYSLNNKANSIFDKNLYTGQRTKGSYASVKDEIILNEIKAIGKLLFFDPILSKNNKRSCASCHKPDEFFTDTLMTTGFHINQIDHLPRNAPTLLNSTHHHLLMHDGDHFNLQSQIIGVLENKDEMANTEAELVKKLSSVKTYKKAFEKFGKHTYSKEAISIKTVASALSIFLEDLGEYKAPFDNAMDNGYELSTQAIEGFNLFMSKTQCATCHFVPQFNGVKPPYVGSEFEVIGVPEDTSFSVISDDNGRFEVYESDEMFKAFRTGTLRNIMHTAPYMHNGVFKTMDEVLDFYNNGGGVGHGLEVANQTLPTDSLSLTSEELGALKSFMHTLTEAVEVIEAPDFLPTSSIKSLNERKVGGEY